MSPAKIKFFGKTNIYSKPVTPKYKKSSNVGVDHTILIFVFTFNIEFDCVFQVSIGENS